MSIGRIDSEQALREFVKQEMGRSDLAVMVRGQQRLVGPPVNRAAVLGTAYQPNAARPTLVVVTGNGAGTATEIDTYMDAAASPTTRIAVTSSSGSWTTHSFIVPAGYYYRLDAGGGTPNLLYVQEYTL